MADASLNLKKRGHIFRVPATVGRFFPHAESRETVYNRIIVTLAKQVLRAQGITATVVGVENIPATGGAMLVMNHTGYYDFVFGMMPAHLRGKRLVRFMAKKEIFDVPVIGKLMNVMKHVPVDRERGATSIAPTIEALRAGKLVGIFPEATISRSFELKDFKTGAVRIADAADAPLIPMACWGSQRIWTKGGKKNLGRTKLPVRIHVGEPVDPSGDPEEATVRLKAAVQALLDDARAGYEAEHGPFDPGADWLPVSMGGSAPTLEEANRMDEEDRAAKRARREAKAKGKR